jgi:hypothetical protein
MKKLAINFIINILITIPVYSQLYFPLHIGDKFIYKYYYSCQSQPSNYSIVITYNYKIRIDRDTLINSKRYFPYKGMWVRVDTITGSLLKYDPGNTCGLYYYENILDSLASPLNGFLNICGDGYKCNSIVNDSLYSQGTNSKNFYYSYFSSGINMIFNRKYNSKFGLTFKDSTISQWWIGGSVNVIQSHTLLGCVINGIVYGDTTITDIGNIPLVIPSSFSLSQNYPNPFNPSTSIKYQVASIKHIKLVVFDILGKEIAILVNEKQTPGTYEVNWDASAFPSGVYFYKLSTDDFTETKKMVLIK